MSTLTYAARNFLVQFPEITQLLAVDSLGDPMIYPNRPESTVENTQKCMIVITSTEGWGSNDHNTARFPILVVDIWADPTRNPDMSVKMKDSDLKIEAVYAAVDRRLHRVDGGQPGGGSIFWGTPSEIAAKTGVRIISSKRQNEPDIQPAFDSEGALMGRVRYYVTI